MSKRVFIVHQWGASPKADWYPWLEEKLRRKGFSVHVPEMPEADTPKITTWVTALTKAVGVPDEQTFFVGHSVGCQTIWRYLEQLPADKKVGGVVCVAGWLTLKNISGEEMQVIKPWLETPIDLKAVKQRASKTTAIFSDNDPWVPLNNQAALAKNLGAKTILLSQRKHFSAEEGITEIPEAFQAVLKQAA